MAGKKKTEKKPAPRTGRTKRKRNPTPAQKARAKKVVNGIAKGKKQGEAMRDAGLSESYSKNPQQYKETAAFREESGKFLERLDVIRDDAMERMMEKSKKAYYGELVSCVRDFTKLIQLCQGKATERVSFVEDNRIIEILDGYPKEQQKTILGFLKRLTAASAGD